MAFPNSRPRPSRLRMTSLPQRKRYRKLGRHGSGSIWRPLRPTIWMTVPLPPPPMSFRRRKSGVVRAGRHTKHVAKLSMLLRRPEPPAHHRLRWKRVPKERTGGVYDCNADCPSPSAPLVYVFLGVGACGWTGGADGRRSAWPLTRFMPGMLRCGDCSSPPALGHNRHVPGTDEDVNIESMYCLVCVRVGWFHGWGRWPLGWRRACVVRRGKRVAVAVLFVLVSHCCFAVYCYCVCLVALALLLAVVV